MTKKRQPTVTIHCVSDELVPVEKLVPNPRNPNTHTKRQIEILAKVILHQGFRRVITVSNQTGFIVAGHARLAAAKVLGMDRVPVDYQDYDSEALEWADLLADNRIAELAEIDNKALKDLLEEMDTGEIDVELTGFDEAATEGLMTQFNPTSEDEQPRLDLKTPVVCPKCKHEFVPQN